MTEGDADERNKPEFSPAHIAPKEIAAEVTNRIFQQEQRRQGVCPNKGEEARFDSQFRGELTLSFDQAIVQLEGEEDPTGLRASETTEAYLHFLEVYRKNILNKSDLSAETYDAAEIYESEHEKKRPKFWRRFFSGRES